MKLIKAHFPGTHKIDGEDVRFSNCASVLKFSARRKFIIKMIPISILEKFGSLTWLKLFYHY